MNYYSAKEILAQRGEVPLIDVRTPAEFEEGHIPGAINLPLFSNEERVVVGTLYKKRGKDIAVEKGLEFVGPKMAYFVKEAKKIAGEGKRINVHCWRGGMRSGSMAWLLSTAGLNVGLLTGGYKAYRGYIRKDFLRPQKIYILGGMTGSGKTDILHHLKDFGEQIIDLEGIASHRGSAFGALGQEPQPSNEMFENLIWEEWNKCDLNRPVWIEDESRAIGSVWLNEALYEAMSLGRVVFLNMPFELRVERLMVDYGTFPGELLKEQLQRISKRLGYDKVKDACEDIDNGNIIEAVRVALRYYDKTYAHCLTRKSEYTEVETTTADSLINAKLLLTIDL